MNIEDPIKLLDLSRLAVPFPQDDIEWRVRESGIGQNNNKIYCKVLAYITARAIQARLDDVCGPENWRNEPPAVHELRPGVVMVVTGIAIKIGDEWITKYDVSEPSKESPVKGAFSGAMKRAGACWSVGRYLYRLEEEFAEVSDTRAKGYRWAQLSEKYEKRPYFWKPPRLPAWALPSGEKERGIVEGDLSHLKRKWMDKFEPGNTNRAELAEGFERFIHSIVGEFPVSDLDCWTSDALQKCFTRIDDTTDPLGPDADVPFAGEGE